MKRTKVNKAFEFILRSGKLCSIKKILIMNTLDDHYQSFFSLSIKEWDIDQEKCVRSYKGTVCVELRLSP